MKRTRIYTSEVIISIESLSFILKTDLHTSCNATFLDRNEGALVRCSKKSRAMSSKLIQIVETKFALFGGLILFLANGGGYLERIFPEATTCTSTFRGI